MAISQYPAESQESYRRNRNCLPEIAPQGHFLALRAQGATAPTGPRNDKLGGIARSAALPNNRQPARRSLSAATGRLLVPAILMAAGTKRQCLPEIATGAERPRNDKFGSIVPSAMLPYKLARRGKALAERRYRRNRFVRFIAALERDCKSPSRDSHVASLLGMTNRKTSPSYRQPVRAANVSPGPAVRSPTARGWEPSCNSLFLIPRAWAGGWSGRSRDPSPPAAVSALDARAADELEAVIDRCSGTAARPAR